MIFAEWPGIDYLLLLIEKTTSIFCLQNNFRNLHFTLLRAALLNATQDMSNGDISLPANFKAKILP